MEETIGVTETETPVESPTTEPTEPTAPEQESSTETEKPKVEEVVEDKSKQDSKKPETRATKRIRQLVDERNELRKKLEGKAPQTPAKQEPAGQTTEVRQAVNELKALGFTTKEDLQRIQDRSALDGEYARLEKEYSGVDGSPKFDRKVVEDYSISSGIYNPRAAYEDLYRDELKDIAVKQALASKPNVPFTEKPTASGGKKSPLTRADIGKMSNAEYQQRHSEIMEAMSAGTL